MFDGDPIRLRLPLKEDVISQLSIGDRVSLSGVLVTGRDAVHRWLADTFIRPTNPVSDDDKAIFEQIKTILMGGAIYHCGPVVSGVNTRDYKVVAAGPTTSMRQEGIMAEVLRSLGIKAVIGKGGMGARTLQALQEVKAIYLHAVGGAAVVMAERVKRVIGVHKLEFGVPEAMWVLEVEQFPLVVTMDAHGNSLHEHIRQRSKQNLERFV